MSKDTAVHTSTSSPQPKFRKDYAPPQFCLDTVDLRFELGEEQTIVHARLQLRNRLGKAGESLVLHGENLQLEGILLDGKPLARQDYSVDAQYLTVFSVPAQCELKTTVVIKPQENTELSGLYKSNGMFCTQCEAEGFRRITFFPDRPDVMARYQTTIVGDRSRYPVMLANGNRVEEGILEDGRHWVQWEDPFPKPSYLFALVAGDLRCHSGQFTTMSGRDVRLELWVEPQNIDRCEHALHSLKKAMAWDEQEFGREYDLDIYMIVAVNDFNMGAMENKGLNIFNAKCVLASPETATDDDYESIEAIIAHEYFHNWTGNRVTCRDWFQLTLKEGLTVYRDQRFTADATSAAVKRIDDVNTLRLAQFPEDAGPMAHPIRPEQYIEMNNFYTVTVYEKGAEIIRMYETLLGRAGFRKGMDLYFERHDGQAVTCDDFRTAMADANHIDLDQFAHWYSQKGTPQLTVTGEYDANQHTYTLTLQQHAPVNVAKDEYQPLHIPVAVGLLGPNGKDLPLQLHGETTAPVTTKILELKNRQQKFTFTNILDRPIPSILRNFSAPVKLSISTSREELAFLMAHDSDPVNRWDAGQRLAQMLLLELVDMARQNLPLTLDPLFVEAFGHVLAEPGLDGSYQALMLTLPDERILAQAMDVVDVDSIHQARHFTRIELAKLFRGQFLAIYNQHHSNGAYQFDQPAVHRRQIKNLALAYLTALCDSETTELAMQQFLANNNMTDVQAALVCLNHIDVPERREALTSFYERWHQDPLVLDKWFAIQASSSLVQAPDIVQELAKHPQFTLKNPNRVRALVAGFCLRNQVRFHCPSGQGYRFLADIVLQLDAINPQIAARLITALNDWRRFDEGRKSLMKTELERIYQQHQSGKLSADVYEIVARALA